MGLAPADRNRLIHAPRALTAEQKNALLVEFRVMPEQPVKLSALNNVRATSRVEFFSPHHVTGYPDRATFGESGDVEGRPWMWPPHENARASILFHLANPANRHLIDICVAAEPNGPQATFTLAGAVNETRTVDAGLRHLTSVIEPNSGANIEIDVSSGDAWTFYFAELTPVA